MRLENEEKIIFKVHPHWLYVTVPEIALIILGFLFLRIAHTLPYWILALFTVAFAMLVVFLDWLCVNYYLTNLRFIEEREL